MMTSSGRVLVSVLAAVVASAAPASPEESSQSQFEGPRMEIEPESFDFGDVRQNQELVHEFIVRNVGSEPLEIRKIVTSCGCTAALVSERVIAPGGESALRVTVETRRYRGRKERTVSIASNDRRRVLQVRLQAFVQASE